MDENMVNGTQEQVVTEGQQQTQVPQQAVSAQPQVVYVQNPAPTEPQKEGILSKAKRHWKPIVGFVVGVAGMVLGGKKLYDKGAQAGYNGAMQSMQPQENSNPIDPNGEY